MFEVIGKRTTNLGDIYFCIEYFESFTDALMFKMEYETETDEIIIRETNETMLMFLCRKWTQEHLNNQVLPIQGNFKTK